MQIQIEIKRIYRIRIMEEFDPKELANLYRPAPTTINEDNGQVMIIGGSSLFHGAPILSLKVASRIVDMVFFSSPEPSVGKIAFQLKSQLGSFIWVPWEEVEAYIEKSDAALLGPGFMRYRSEHNPHGDPKHFCDETCQQTRIITKRLLSQFPSKKWVIDAGSLQVMDPSWIPKNAILTPNRKEFEMLFGKDGKEQELQAAARKHNCLIVLKGETTVVCSGKTCFAVKGGNPGLTKGGTGDVQAGLTVALLAKNEPFLAAKASSWIIKHSADNLYTRVGAVYNADDLAQEIPQVLSKYLR